MLTDTKVCLSVPTMHDMKGVNLQVLCASGVAMCIKDLGIVDKTEEWVHGSWVSECHRFSVVKNFISYRDLYV